MEILPYLGRTGASLQITKPHTARVTGSRESPALVFRPHVIFRGQLALAAGTRSAAPTEAWGSASCLEKHSVPELTQGKPALACILRTIRRIRNRSSGLENAIASGLLKTFSPTSIYQNLQYRLKASRERGDISFQYTSKNPRKARAVTAKR